MYLWQELLQVAIITMPRLKRVCAAVCPDVFSPDEALQIAKADIHWPTHFWRACDMRGSP